MKEIQLTQGKVALVDDEDYEYLMQWRWHLTAGAYAARDIENKKVIYMHRFLMNAQKGQEIDHINQNKLDNRKSNLRACTRAENMRNTKKRSQNTSGYKGVTWHDLRKKWAARLKYNYQDIHIGLYNTPIEAARAYDAKAKELFGEFASLNFPE